MGLTVEDVAPAAIELWPENEDAFLLFCQMGTQWRVGMGGPVGLDYAALPVVMDMAGIDAAARPLLFEAVRVMENAALAEMCGE